MLVARHIVRDAVRAGLAPGDVLPPERAMLETYRTCRGTLREARRLLEFQGVITLKPGPGAGPVLLTPPAARLASTLQLLMPVNGSGYGLGPGVRLRFPPSPWAGTGSCAPWC